MAYSIPSSINSPRRIISSRIFFFILVACATAIMEWIWIPAKVLDSLPGFSSRIAVFFLIICTLCTMAIFAGLIWGVLISVLNRTLKTQNLYKKFKSHLMPIRGGKPAEVQAISGLLALCFGLVLYSSAGLLVFQQFYRSNFQNHSLAALLTVFASLGIAALAIPITIPVQASLLRLLTRISETPRGSKTVTFDNTLISLSILASLGIALYLVVFWKTIIQIKDYEFYLFLARILLLLIILQPVWRQIRNRVTPMDPIFHLWPILLILTGLGMSLLATHPSAQFVVAKRSPLSGHLLNFAKSVVDLDRDGYPAILGGGDCDPFDSKVYPDALEIPGNGIDDNCFGGDRPKKSYINQDQAFDMPSDFRDKDFNVLFISIDATRARNVSWHGSKRDTTPKIAQWIKDREAFVFDRAYCNVPATRWVIPQIHSSLYPSDIKWDTKTFPHTIKRENLMLAEVLNQHGFYTSAYWTMDKKRWGQNQGFKHFVDEGAGKKISGNLVSTYGKEFLNENKDERFFLWLHYFDPHAPYQNHKDLNYGKKAIDRYDEEINYVDRQIDQLFKKLEELKLWERTIVILTSDHGEEFREHGKRFHSYNLYEEAVHVPLVWWIPGLVGKRLPHIVDHMDLMPTILNLFEYSDGWSKFRGSSYASLFFGSDQYNEQPAFLSTSWVAKARKGSVRGVVDRDHKILYDVQSQVFELYDLKNDPLESLNIFENDHPAVRRLMPVLQHEMDEILPNKTFH